MTKLDILFDKDQVETVKWYLKAAEQDYMSRGGLKLATFAKISKLL